ncbi:MAG: ABC transporter permease [Promethearchaeota archaeon]
MTNLEIEEELTEHQLRSSGETKGSPSKVVSGVFRSIKFAFLPRYRITELISPKSFSGRMKSNRSKIHRLKSLLTIIGIILIIFVVTLALFGPWISPYTYQRAMGGFIGQAWSPPSPAHILGTSRVGKDVFSRVIFGARTALIIPLLSVLISVVFGIILGLIAAYYGKWVDQVIMRVMDIILAFPGIILALSIIAITRPSRFAPLQQSLINTILIFGFIGIPYFSRIVRGSVLQVRELPYITAARVAGAGNARIMFKHILPNCLQPIIIAMTFKIGSTIISMAVLSYLGFSDARLIDWGNDIAVARANIINAPWASLWPSIMIVITILGFMLLGDGLRDVFDIRTGNKV